MWKRIQLRDRLISRDCLTVILIESHTRVSLLKDTTVCGKLILMLCKYKAKNCILIPKMCSPASNSEQFLWVQVDK